MFRKTLFTVVASIIAYQGVVTAEDNVLNSAVRIQNQEQIQKDIQNQAQQLKKEIKKTLVDDAIAIKSETQRALGFIKKGLNGRALAALERGIGKADVLLARHPDETLPPIDFTLSIVDIAPKNLEKISEITHQGVKAINSRDYSKGRTLLSQLRSEIKVDIICLPLATFSQALKDAARSLELGNRKEASSALETALTSLVAHERIHPIPVLEVIATLTTAENLIEKDPENALKLMERAKVDLSRAVELGYLAKNDNYNTLNDEIVNLEDEIKRPKPSSSYFSAAKEKLRVIIKNTSGFKSVTIP